MKTIVWILVAVFQVFLLNHNLVDSCHEVTSFFHGAAKAFINRTQSPWNWFYGAILIGEDEGIRNNLQIQSFLTLGLYHLIVVSGSHIRGLQVVVTSTTNWLPPRIQSWIVTLVLISFTLVNRMQASCMRAFLAWCLGSFGQKKFFGPRSDADLNMVVICLCLAIEPAWAKSLSFQLSCSATLGLSIVRSLELEKGIGNRIAESFFCTLLTAPLVFSIQPCLSWLVIPSNTLALPFFELILMPVSLLSILLPFIRPLTDHVLIFVFGFCSWLSQFENPLFCFEERKLDSWGLVYIVFVYLSWRLVLPYYHRHRFWKNQLNPNGNSFSGT